MVCAKKSAAAVATAASSVYQTYTSSATPAASALVTPVGNSGSNSSVSTSTLAATSSATASNSGVRGFNYGAFFMDYTAKKQADFEYEFERAQDLDGTSGWTSARLYTMSTFPPFTLMHTFRSVPFRSVQKHWNRPK